MDLCFFIFLNEWDYYLECCRVVVECVCILFFLNIFIVVRRKFYFGYIKDVMVVIEVK